MQVELDVVTAARIDELVAQGADLHSFLESLRQPGRTPGHGVRQLHRTSDFSVLPSFLTAQQDAFSFRFSKHSGAGGGAAGGDSPMETEPRAGAAAFAERQAWRACTPVRDAALRRDHSSLQVRAKERGILEKRKKKSPIPPEKSPAWAAGALTPQP